MAQAPLSTANPSMVNHRHVNPDLKLLAQEIASSVGGSVTAVAEVLEEEIRRLRHTARIADFIPILAMKRAKEIVRKDKAGR